MTIYRQNINKVEAPQLPQLGPLVGGKIAKRSRVVGVFRGQSKTAALGRRVVAAQSVASEVTWSVPDDDPVSAMLTHPTPTTSRVVGYARSDLTPGHFLALSLLYIPSGQTQVDIGATYAAGGAGGVGRADATWHDQDAGTDDTYKTLALQGSNLADGAAPTGSIAWSLIKLATDKLSPSEILANADVSRWTEHVGVDLELSHAAGARPLDFVVSEVPVALARDHADPDDQQVSGLYGDPDPDASGPSVTHPVEEVATDDPRTGTLHLANVAAAQGLRLGPHLVSWTSYVESDAGPTTTTLAPVSTFSTSFVRLQDQEAIGYDANEPGWSLSCGAYARGYAENHPYFADHVGTIPVIVAVYAGAGIASGTGTVRIQASEWSWIDVTVPDPNERWLLAYGHLTVGKGPGDPSIVQAFFRRDTGVDPVRVYAVSIYHAGQYAPTF